MLLNKIFCIINILDHVENSLFHWGLPIFPKITVNISLLSDWKIYSFIGFGDTIWDQEGTVSKIIDRGSNRGTFHGGT